MKTAIISVPGRPQGKARPRITRHGTYTPQRTREYEQRIRAAWREAGGVRFGAAPVSVEVHAYFEPPKSAGKRRRDEMLRYGLPCRKPDADNILKAVCDALNGLCYDDDAQVVLAAVSKKWGIVPGIVVTVTEAEAQP